MDDIPQSHSPTVLLEAVSDGEEKIGPDESQKIKKRVRIETPEKDALEIDEHPKSRIMVRYLYLSKCYYHIKILMYIMWCD